MIAYRQDRNRLIMNTKKRHYESRQREIEVVTLITYLILLYERSKRNGQSSNKILK
jgi:hypothetical protein